ncbi:helix-turn-helix transcriptional regulator [Brevibacterium marinum]|uniref:AraC-like DNA-binding protein n=1 Tax=Brevibacterium marinum TaxID=418643 RepID=A0A846RWU9_9MICO|nr:helix-turn-helix transcriptional regulator [Brevibacterium marinum]NJC58714.1 AraC-like DNA-binding protein [Brevibacterium marinum]
MPAATTDDLIRSPHPRLRAFVGDYVGYDISGVPAGTHLGLPSGALTFIVAIDRPLQQYDAVTDTAESFDVLLAGLHLKPTLIRHNGTLAGIQINFTPFAPRAFFAIPAVELAHRTHDLGEISRPVAAELHERVNEAPTWSARFDAIDQVLLRAIDDGAGPRREVTDSWRQIARSHGEVPVSRVAEEVGWSRRYLNGQFRAEFGIGPKEAARVMRFDRARRMISTQTRTLADIAAICGYSDQSHLNRDFRALTGTSPRGWLSEDPVVRQDRDRRSPE